MIDKIIHFIWLGKKDVPAYGKFAMDVFRKVNPSFDIRLHRDDPDDPQTDDLKEVLRLIHSDTENYYKLMFYRKWAVKHLQTKIGVTTNVTDCLRWYLVQKYGGIYIDIDTFPVRPFDDELLSKGSFIVRKFFNHRYDNFFFGFEKGKLFDHMYFHKGISDYQTDNINCEIEYLEFVKKVFRKDFLRMKERFFARKTEYGESAFKKELIPYYYIDHFASNEWRR